MTTISASQAERLHRTHPELFSTPLSVRLRVGAVWAVFLGVMALGLWWIDANPLRIVEGFGKLGLLVTQMIPPHPGESFRDFAEAMFETLAMAFLGTTIAAVLAVPLGFLGARNVVPNWLFHFSLRRVYDGLRGIDGLVWALIFVSAVGLGPFAGVLAIAVADLMIFAKLYAEAIENIDRKPVEGVRAAGGANAHVLRLGVVPQVLPVMLSHVLYFFESNVRSATILGIVGAGGIGVQLADRMRINNWQEVSFIILMILVTVSIIDAISRRIRAALI